jgi:hypothetical protein
VLLSAVLVCVMALATATVVLLAVGVRVRVAAPLVGPVLAALVSAFAGVVATRLWSVPVESIWDAGTVLTASALVISLARPRWNPVAQAFAGIAIGSSLVYPAFGAIVTFASGLSAIASIASGLLLILEAAALTCRPRSRSRASTCCARRTRSSARSGSTRSTGRWSRSRSPRTTSRRTC